MIYVLVHDGKAIYASRLMECLSEAMAPYDAVQQAQMHIDAVPVLE